MKGYFLIVSIIVAIISILVTLNVFFQQSLQMEIAEQFNKEQLLLSRSIANNIRSYLQFMKEEALEVAHEFAEKPYTSRAIFEEITQEEMKHKGVLKTVTGLIDSEGRVVVINGNRELIGQVLPEIVSTGKALPNKNVSMISAPESVTIVAPVYRQNRLCNIIFISFAVTDIANHFLENVRAESSGYAWMINRNGDLLYHPTHPEMIGRNLYKADASCFKCHLSFDFEKKMLEGKSGNYGRYIAPHGEDKILAFADVDREGLSWLVVMSSPYSDITRVTGQSMKLYSYLIISIFVATTVVSAILIVMNKKRIQAIELEKRQRELEHYTQDLENKVAERTAELKGEKEKLDTIVSTIGGGLVLMDKDGKVQWTNNAVRDMAGIDITGMNCEDVCKDCHISGTYIKDGIETMVMSNLFGKNNVFFQVTTAPIKSDDGAVHGYIRLVQDITEIKKMEEQIIHSEKLASIGRLAAGIAHEIGNPMTSIFSFVQILRESEEDKFKKDSLDTIYFHVNRVSEILKQLSGFSKMPAGEPKECHINEVIETSLNLIQYDKKAKNVTIKKDLADNIPVLTLDGNQLSQVFVNLILNAFDAIMDDGSLEVRSYVSNGNVVIAFRDTGVGISKSDLARIFDPFHTTKEKGTGLGLAVSYNIIKKMNGTLTVESEQGKGATFLITLPLKGPISNET
ncbi:MAG: sensor histidine kinase [Nitrospirae bacterium]|nr:MAG: sensor histidine kinase [Nitrospirota bacterium]